jgi:cytochrome P450
VVGDLEHEQKTRKEDFNKSVVIDTLVDPRSAKDHSILDAGQVADEVIMLLSAGNDTTSDAMIVGIYQIVKNKRVYGALNAELKSAFPQLGQDITYSNSCRLPYLVRQPRFEQKHPRV